MPRLPRGVLLAIAAVTTTVAAGTEPTEPAPLVPAEATPTSAVRAPLVLAGIAGLRWQDVSPDLTPTLWQLLEDGASAAAVTIYTYGRPACAEGGWLSISAGRAVRGATFGSWCHTLPEVVPSTAGARVEGWAELAAENLETLYRPRLGTLGQALAEAEVCATAVGPGAALALAGIDGSVPRYFATPEPDAFDCPLTVVDLGATTALSGVDGGRLPVDRALEDLVAMLPPGTDLVLTSVASPAGAPLALGVGVVATDRSSTLGGRLLTSPSTRWEGVVRLLDLPSTLTASLGVPEPALFNGSPVVLGEARPATRQAVAELAGLSATDRVLRSVAASFVNGLSAIGLLLAGAAALVLRRRRHAADTSGRGRPLLRGLELSLLTLGAAPVSAYLVGLVPWWQNAASAPALWMSIIAIAALLAVIIWVSAGRSGPVWRPAILLSSLTVAVLLVDALLGTPLHRLSPLGPSAVTGGRYYGIGNSSFAVLAAHALILSGGLAAWALARGRRAAAVLVVAAVGTVTLVIDVGPTWGADLGGAPALLPAFVVLAMLISGTAVSWRRTVLIGAGAVVVIALIALLDWLRPAAQRSHAGRFVQSVVDGDAWETVSRKASFAVATVTSGPVAVITLVIFIALVVWARRSDQLTSRELRVVLPAWPTLLPTLIALLVVLGLGALANDYGVRVITIGLTSGLPVLGAALLAAVDRPMITPSSAQAGGKLPARGSIAGTS